MHVCFSIIFFFWKCNFVFPFEWIGNIACLTDLMPSLFSLHDAKILCVILLSPSLCVSESVVKRSWFQSDIRLQSTKLHQLCIHSHSAYLCCPFHWIPRKSLLSPAHISYRSSGTYVYIMSPSLWPAKLATMNFTEVYDWTWTASPGTESSSGCILAVRQTSRHTEAVHEWIGNIPVPQDKSIMWWRECSGKHLVLQLLGGLGPCYN